MAEVAQDDETVVEGGFLGGTTGRKRRLQTELGLQAKALDSHAHLALRQLRCPGDQLLLLHAIGQPRDQDRVVSRQIAHCLQEVRVEPEQSDLRLTLRLRDAELPLGLGPGRVSFGLDAVLAQQTAQLSEVLLELLAALYALVAERLGRDQPLTEKALRIFGVLQDFEALEVRARRASKKAWLSASTISGRS